MEDKIPEKRARPPEPPQAPTPPPEVFLPKQEQNVHSAPRPRTQRQSRSNQPKFHTSEQNSKSISSFLKQLLPKDFDTSDLMIVLLLLIMSGDCAKDQNTALLTLVLYLFM